MKERSATHVDDADLVIRLRTEEGIIIFADPSSCVHAWEPHLWEIGGAYCPLCGSLADWARDPRMNNMNNMTAYDKELSARLCREAREDDATIPGAPWRVTKDSAEKSGKRYFPSLLTHEPISWHDRVVINDSITGKPTTMERYDAIADAMARSRNNLGALADQLEAAGRDVEHWRDARRVAIEAGEMLKAALEAARSALENHSGVVASLHERCEQLTAELNEARAERDLMRPVVEAAVLEREARCTCDAEFGHYSMCARFCVERVLEQSVDAYRARKAGG